MKRRYQFVLGGSISVSVYIAMSVMVTGASISSYVVPVEFIGGGALSIALSAWQVKRRRKLDATKEAQRWEREWPEYIGGSWK